MTRRIATLLLAIFAGAEAIRGQAPQQPTFRVRVDAVEIDASVTDARGNPVTTLTADDFEILEDKKPQTISSFTLVNIPTHRVEPTTFAGRPIEPDVQSNQEGEGRLYVFVLDEVSGAGALRARLFLRRFIDKYFGANDVAAVSFLGRARGANAQSLTSNRRLLLESIDTFSGGFPGGSGGTPSSAVSGEPLAQGAQLSSPASEADFNLRNQMNALRKIAEAVAAIKGRRKMLLLFSENMPINMQRVIDYSGGTLSLQEEDAHQAITAATRSNVTIYPIDPRGLTADGGLAEDEAAPTRDVFADLGNRMNLSALASVTGGFALTNSNSFDQAFDRIVRENSSYYVLGYTSSNDRRDGRYRRLQVRVKRPGLQVPLAWRVPRSAREGATHPGAETHHSTRSIRDNSRRQSRRHARHSASRLRRAIQIGARRSDHCARIRDRRRIAVARRQERHDGRGRRGRLSRLRCAETRSIRASTTSPIFRCRPNEYDKLRRGGLRVLSQNATSARTLSDSRCRRRSHRQVGQRCLRSRRPRLRARRVDDERGVADIEGVVGHEDDAAEGTAAGHAAWADHASREFDRGDTITLFAEVYENASRAPHKHRSAGGAARRGWASKFGRVTEQRSSTELDGEGRWLRLHTRHCRSDVAPGAGTSFTSRRDRRSAIARW
jgi:VWFA-related protein